MKEWNKEGQEQENQILKSLLAPLFEVSRCLVALTRSRAISLALVITAFGCIIFEISVPISALVLCAFWTWVCDKMYYVALTNALTLRREKSGWAQQIVRISERNIVGEVRNFFLIRACWTFPPTSTIHTFPRGSTIRVAHAVRNTVYI